MGRVSPAHDSWRNTLLKITGLESLTRQLDQARSALEALAGEVEVSFDPNDPQSIETAIQSVEAMVDERVADWAGNELVADIATEMKDKYREAIVERAAVARLGEGSDD